MHDDHAATTHASPSRLAGVGWDPKRGVFILAEADHLRAVRAGVALETDCRRRPPPRPPLTVCDRRERRSRRPMSVWEAIGWIMVGCLTGLLACQIAAILIERQG